MHRLAQGAETWVSPPRHGHSATSQAAHHLCYYSSPMNKSRSIPRRRPKAAKPLKLVIYLSDDENRLIERAAAASGRSKSAFGADVILKEASSILGTKP